MTDKNNYGRFKNSFGLNTFRNKYAQGPDDTWDKLAERLVDDVCGTRGATTTALLSREDQRQLAEYIKEFKFIPGGRYLYYAGRPYKAYNNCYLLRAEEDTREEWSNVTWRAMSCLMTGGGIGIDYSRLRAAGKALGRTGGTASGPLPLMFAINEIGRNVMQGGSRRSAIYASLNWQHEDINAFLHAKNWSDTIKQLKTEDFNFPAPLDMTNISVNYDDAALNCCKVSGMGTQGPVTIVDRGLQCNPIFLENCKQAMMTGEPGFSFNFGDKQNETLRNACTEVTSEDDSDVCNLGSINMGNIQSLEEFRSVVGLASKFLVCGTLRADLPYKKVYDVREKNRRLGLGLMGIHEWLLQRGFIYGPNEELETYLKAYKKSTDISHKYAKEWNITLPVKTRAIAPTGTIGIVGETTTGIEPIFCVSYKRRYLKGDKWHYQYVIDPTAKRLIDSGINANSIEDAYVLAENVERRLSFQAWIQEYVDHAISSTINLPAWGSEYNNESRVLEFGNMLMKYLPKLRGITVYPDGSRGGQPLTPVKYDTAIKHKDKIFEEEPELVYEQVDVCDISGKGGSCGS